MIRVLYQLLPEEPDLDFIKRRTPELPDFMQEGVRSFVFEMDQMRSLAAKLLVVEALAPKRPVTELLSNWKTGEYGCPYIPGKTHFNLSHSGNVVIIAVGHRPLGIDVEQIRDVDFELLKNYMRTEEWEDIYRSDDPRARFFHYWTVKEALMKAEGMGFHLPLEEIALTGSGAVIRGKQWHLQSLSIKDGYHAHLATEEPLTFSLSQVNLIS